MKKSCQHPSCASFSERLYGKKVVGRISFDYRKIGKSFFQTFNMMDLRKLVLAVSILSSLMIALPMAVQMLSLY